MGTQNDSNRFSDLKARLAALNCDLLEEDGDDDERFCILDRAKGRLVSVAQSIGGVYEWIEDAGSVVAHAAAQVPAIDGQADGDAAAEDSLTAVFAVCALVHALAERLRDHGSLGVGERGGHDHALFQLLERQADAAVKVASEATR